MIDEGAVTKAARQLDRDRALGLAMDAYANSCPAAPMKHTDILPLAREIEAYLYGDDD